MNVVGALLPLLEYTKIKATVRISSADIFTDISISNNMSDMHFSAILLSRLSNCDNFSSK